MVWRKDDPGLLATGTHGAHERLVASKAAQVTCGRNECVRRGLLLVCSCVKVNECGAPQKTRTRGKPSFRVELVELVQDLSQNLCQK